MNSKEEGACKKYGENHSKLADKLSLVNLNREGCFYVSNTSFGDFSVGMSKVDLLNVVRRLLLRNNFIKLIVKMAKEGNVILDGRDIGTYVLPNADVKIYQIASVQTRAIRRYEENIEKGIPCSLEDIERDVMQRAYIDSHRDFAPLKPAAVSILLDTSFMSVDEVVDAVIEIINKKIMEKNNDK